MASEILGFTPAEVIKFTSMAVPVRYTYVASITLVVYDSLVLLGREVEYIYQGPRSLSRWIYILVKLTGLFIFGFNFAVYSTIHSDSPTLCWVRQWISDFAAEIVYTVVIKTLLVLRLSALYENHKPVTIFLWMATAIEVISMAYGFLIRSLNLQWYIRVPAPVPGCPVGIGTPESPNLLIQFQGPQVIWAIKVATNGFELFLLLFGLYRSLTGGKDGLRRGWIRMKEVTPFLYVFYRDGTVFYIPIFVLSVFGLLATFVQLARFFGCENWDAWLIIIYYITGTRLILNVHSTGTEFNNTMITRQQITTLAFDSNYGTSSELEDEVAARASVEDSNI